MVIILVQPLCTFNQPELQDCVSEVAASLIATGTEVVGPPNDAGERFSDELLSLANGA